MRGTPLYIGPFTGGLNTRDALMELPLNYSPDLLNVIGGQDGTIRKRDPSRSINNNFPAAGANDAITVFYSETQDLFLAMVGAKVYRSPVSGVASTDITGAFAPVPACKWCFVEAPVSGGQGPVYFTTADGGAPFSGQWTGAGNVAAWTSASGTLPTGDFMIYFKSRIIMGGRLVGTNGCGVAASAVGDPRNWDTTVIGTSASYLTNIDPTDGMQITGIGSVGSYAIIFKDRKTYVMFDMDSGANRPLSDTLGLRAGNFRTVTSTPYGLCWLAQDGHVYVTDGAKIDKLSDVISESSAGFGGDLFNQVTLGLPLRVSANPSAMGYFEDKLYLSVSYNTGNRFTFCYDFLTKTWWRFTDRVANYTNYSTATTGSGGLAGGALTAAGAPSIMGLYLQGQNDTSGTGWQDLVTAAANYNAYYCTTPLAPEYFRRRIIENHNLRRRYHAFRGYISGNVDITMASDVLASNPPSYTTLQSVTNQLLDFPSEISVYSLGVANNVQFKFTSTNGFAWELHPFYLYTQPRTD